MRIYRGMRNILIILIMWLGCSTKGDQVGENRLDLIAERVTIIRDNWGIPHIYGKTDADVVFGLMYAQCEDGFEQVEHNYLEKMGRLSEVNGPSYLYTDLLNRQVYDSMAAIKDYEASPPWLKKLLDAFADGVNYFLHKNPDKKPRILRQFEPWFPLLFTDGGYTSMQTAGIRLKDIQQLYPLPADDEQAAVFNSHQPASLNGSNAFAISPTKTLSGKSLLYINPHVRFYFRTEAHLVSEEGLNAYGAITWGQFFVFQGFNQHCGWMHTSTMVDVADLYEERVRKNGDGFQYFHNNTWKNITEKEITLRYILDGKIQVHVSKVFQTHHGPVLGERDASWLSLRANNRSLNGLIQSWQRSKAVDLENFQEILELKSNISTNTMYADGKGNIAYWHGNFLPKRDTSYNWNLPVDGTTSATEWKGLYDPGELVHFINPENGWLQNCNSSAWGATGEELNERAHYPAFMAPEKENFRSLYAIKLLASKQQFTIESLSDLGFDTHLSIFDTMLPPLINAYNSLPESDPLTDKLKAPIDTLKSWNKKSAISSVATSLAIEWVYAIMNFQAGSIDPMEINDQVNYVSLLMQRTSTLKQLELLELAIKGMEEHFGRWKIPWGEINRFQRPLNEGEFDDALPSYPVAMASAFFGSLPAYEVTWAGSKKGYGYAGNSFVAVVEFGDSVKAMAISTGGQSTIPGSKHFNDQAELFVKGNLRPVYFYKQDVLKNAALQYHPGKVKKNK